MDPGPNPRENAPRPPAWLLVFASAMLSCAALERLDAARRRGDAAGLERARLLPVLGARPADAPELASASARELRRLPGIGRRRAEAIVRARREHAGRGFALGEVPGIGPATAARVAAWIARERAQSRVAE